MKEKIKAVKIDILFLLAILIIGIITSFSYGLFLDQNSEKRILYSNIKEYAYCLGMEEAPLIQEMEEQGIPRISESVERDHGMAAYYPMSILWYVDEESPALGNIMHHMYTFLLVFWGIASLYLLVKAMWGSRYLATFVTLLFFCTPRMFAESHYNNKDMVLLSLLLVLFYQGYMLIRNTRWRHVILFALAGALAFNLKLLGICFVGLIGLYVILYFLFTKQFTSRILLKCVICILLFGGLFLLLTPACWSGVIEYFEYVLRYTLDFERWKGSVLYDGYVYFQQIDELPQKYLPVLILLTTPVMILVLALLGGVCWVTDIVRKRLKAIWNVEGYIGITLLAGGIPLAYAVLAGTFVYNGWRHFYFVYGSIIMAVAYGAYRGNAILRKYLERKWRLVAAALGVLVLAVPLGVNYPQAHSYYNFWAGDGVERRYETDYWQLSMKEALDVVLEAGSGSELITIGSQHPLTLLGMDLNFRVLPEQDRASLSICGQWQDAEYVIVNMSYVSPGEDSNYLYLQRNYQLLHEIQSYGNNVCEIYKKVY